MREIKRLSDSVINRIAAGEVVERPASVIKELIENAIDAEASKVEVRIENAGKNYISILDDGIGMQDSEIALAIQRHTTSKINEADISNIEFFGFRGEALPSIASVAEMIITSSKNSDQNSDTIGIQCKIQDGAIKQKSSVNFERGTKIEVINLFYTIPARLKFLKSDKTEQAACIDVVKRAALSFHNISFKFFAEGKELFYYPKTESQQERIAQVLGSEFLSNSSEIRFSREDYNITGFTSIPTYNKASASEQYLYVNNRPVKDKLLTIALKVAYQDYLSRDRHPLSIIYLSTNPRLVDVNVHPSKNEVRFREANDVRSMVISAIKDALMRASHNTADNLASKLIESHSNIAQGHMRRDQASQDYSQDHSQNNSQDYNNVSSIADRVSIFNRSYTQVRPQNYRSSARLQHSSSAHTSLFHLGEEFKPLAKQGHESFSADEIKTEIKAQNFPMGAAIAQFHSTYIVSQTEDGIIIVDQHAAHERLVYEELKNNMFASPLATQRLVIPVIVEFADEAYVEKLLGKEAQLSNLGLVLQKFSEKSVIVREVPALLGQFDVEKLIKDLADNLYELEENIALQELIEHVTETYACHYSIRAGRSMSINDMNDLLRKMEQTAFAGQCNHGRPTYVKFTLGDIEKLFRRK